MSRSLVFLLLGLVFASEARAQAPGSTTTLSGGEVVSRAETISISVRKAELTSVLRMIARTAGLNLVLDDELAGKTVTLELDEVPWDQALELVLGLHGLSSEWSGQVMQVGATSDIMADLQQRARLRELREQSGGLVSVARTLDHANAADAERLVAQHLSDRGRVTMDRRTNTLIIQDTPSVIREITGLLDSQDTALESARLSSQPSRSRPERRAPLASWNAWLLESSDSFLQRLDLPDAAIRRVTGTSAVLGRVQLTADDLEVAKLLLGRLTEQDRLKVIGALPFGLAPAGAESIELGPLGRGGGSLRLDLGLDRDGGHFVMTFRCFRGSGGRLPLAWHGPTHAAWIVELQAGPGEPWRVLLIAPAE